MKITSPMENQTDILIFKTNIQTDSDKSVIRELLDTHHAIERWTVDTDDADCVLRIVAQRMSATDIITLITRTGYLCQELE